MKLKQFLTEMAFRKPWEKGAAAYHEADSFADVRKGFGRSRKMQMFILSEKGVKKEKPICAVCKKPITDDSNRCEYYPKIDKIVCMHYNCAWDGIFKDIAKLADYYY